MNQVYDYFFINFARPINHEQVDRFAIEMAKTNAAYKICRVQAHYLNYQVISSNFFTIPQCQDNFRALFTDTDSEKAIDSIAQGLFSLFKSIGRTPLVRVSSSDISERVFRRLSHYYTQHKEPESKASERPLLIVLDRRTDLQTMLYHSWNYLSLIQDIFSIKNNQFIYQEDAKAQPVTYELDFTADEILQENAFRQFHEAAESVDKAMSAWKEEYDKISSKTSSVHDISSSLTQAMDQIPQMTERKKRIEMHVQIASRILAEIKRRGIDELQEFEDDIMTTGRLSAANKAKAGEMLRKETSKPEEIRDKIRLLLINILCGQDQSEIRGMLDTVRSLHADHLDEGFIDFMLKRRAEQEPVSETAQPGSFISGIAKQVQSQSKTLLSKISGLLSD